MEANISGTERNIRIVLALVFAYLYFGNVVTGTLGVVLGVLAGILLLTGFFSFCPIYAVLKKNTKKK